MDLRFYKDPPRDLNLQLCILMLRCYIFPVLPYDSDSWTFNRSLEIRTNAFDMYLNRRILRIFWVPSKNGSFRISGAL